MQGKGLIKFFLILLLVVSLVQYIFVIPTQRVEKKASEHAERVSAGLDDVAKYTASKTAETQYLDSMSSEVIFSIPYIKEYTYDELKKQQLAFGLDLKGGMSVVLQVDIKELLISLSNGSNDPKFRQALDEAEQRQKTEQKSYVALFGEEWRKVADGKRLAQIFQRNAGLRDQINAGSSDGDVIRILSTSAKETVDLTYKRLKDRIDKFGVTQPNVSLDESRDLILVELPGVTNAERARTYLQAAAKLEFWDVYRFDNVIQNAFLQADQRLEKLQAGDTTTSTEPVVLLDSIQVLDTLGNAIPDSFDIVERTEDPFATQGPLLSILDMNGSAGPNEVRYPLAIAGMVDKNKMSVVDRYLEREDIKSLFPRDLKFMWAQKANEFEGSNVEQYALYMIKKQRGSETAPLEGDRVIDARENQDPTNNDIVVSLRMDGKGSRKWAEMTTAAANDNNRAIAIALDDQIVSAPSVNGPITGGSSQIMGGFSLQEAKDLANILQVGKLPAKTVIKAETIVGPTLGKENISKTLRSLIVGLILVLIFMVFYYGYGGMVALLSLLLNIFFIFGALASIGTVLTVPGFAGIILTIGMAVDVNVIIFERIREELRIGKTMSMAIKDGFKHSYSAIIDANVTTLLTAFVLAYFGMGPIKGFAVVLIIGVLSSLFTAMLVGRLIIEWWIKKDRPMSFWTPPTKNAFASLSVDWLSKRKIAYAVSLSIIGAGIVSMATQGFDLGVDFKGGYSYNVEFDRDLDINTQDIRTALAGPLEKEPTVKTVDALNTYNITTDYLIDNTDEDVADNVMQKLYDGISTLAGGSLDFDQFKSPDGIGTHVTSSTKVQATIADDIKDSAVYATIFALLLIFLYIFIRFSKWQYSLGAVAALFHDTLLVLGLFSLLKNIMPFTLEIDQAFIAALLTVIGYSINDTVVVFDRIREFINNYTQKPKHEIVNAAINSTLSRTVITSVTTLFVIVMLLIFGGSSIKGFAFALFIGVLVGTYSSIFIATPVMVDLSKELKGKNTADTSKSFSKAAKVK